MASRICDWLVIGYEDEYIWYGVMRKRYFVRSEEEKKEEEEGKSTSHYT